MFPRNRVLAYVRGSMGFVLLRVPYLGFPACDAICRTRGVGFLRNFLRRFSQKRGKAQCIFAWSKNLLSRAATRAVPRLLSVHTYKSTWIHTCTRSCPWSNGLSLSTMKREAKDFSLEKDQLIRGYRDIIASFAL